MMENNLILLIDSGRFSCIDRFASFRIALVVDSRDQKQSFCLAATAHSRQFFFNPTDTHSITFFSVNTDFAIVYGASPRFDHDLFKHYRMFHFSFLVINCFSSDLQTEIQSIKFFSDKSCGIQISRFFMYPFLHKWPETVL